MTRPSTVLLDIGGVLTPDPWQTLVLTPGRGIAERLGINTEMAREVAGRLWPEFSRASFPEDEYWHQFSRLAGCEVTRELVSEVEGELMWPNPDSAKVFGVLETGGVAWGVISDNTSFWYPKQLRILGLDGRVGAELEFLSFRYGVSKNEAGTGLYDIASRQLDASAVIVVDDRMRNLDRARDLGFRTVHFHPGTHQPDQPLSTLLRSLLEEGA